LVLFVSASLVLLTKYENLYYFWFDVPIFLYSLLVGGFLLSRFLFAAFYGDSKPLAELPTISVVVPVRNEEEHIARTLRQLMESSYPRERLQVIAVDDCSTDGTLAVMKDSQKTYPELVVLGLEKNAGKRHALAAGTGLANGQVIVFIDSDSFLEPDALRHLVNRFVDPKVAAVTGHCDVENVWTNLLTRMQTVRYFIAFRVMKAAESVFDSVTCLSGPIAAYRREVLQEVMPEWLNQMFMGRPATFGDDRSLTNSLLRRGYKVVYEFKARVTTIVPDDHRTFLRQQLRWKRSWFRESLIAAGFMWRKQPLMALSFYLGFILPLLGPAIVLRALVYVPLVQRTSPIMYLVGITLMSALISSTYLLYRRSRLWYYGTVFCFYYMFVLVWQTPWAVLTSWKNQWITRS
jgi:hyaluronan synthase